MEYFSSFFSNLLPCFRLTTTSPLAADLFQQSSIPSSTNIFTTTLENHFGTDLPKNFNNPFSVAPTSLAPITALTNFNDQYKSEALDMQQATGNGYQKLLPPYCSPTPLHSRIDNDVVDHHLASKLNRMMYTQSPQLPRKTYEIHSNIPHIGSQSPFMQRKFPANEGGNYNPYKPLPQQPSSTFSPVIRKRYQEGHLVSEDLEFRILHGNTSPIVLQRFYHQQNQLKDQKEADELRAIRLQSASPNPFKSTQSSIPVKSNSNSPLPSLRYQHHQMPRNNFEPLPSQRIYESQIPQLQSRMVSNGNGTMQNMQNMYRHPQHQPMYDNVRAQMACPGSPQLDRLKANLEKPNFYERHQKLPVEIENPYQQMEMNMNQNNGLIGDKNKDKGKLRELQNFF